MDRTDLHEPIPHCSPMIHLRFLGGRIGWGSQQGGICGELPCIHGIQRIRYLRGQEFWFSLLEFLLSEVVLCSVRDYYLPLLLWPWTGCCCCCSLTLTHDVANFVQLASHNDWPWPWLWLWLKPKIGEKGCVPVQLKFGQRIWVTWELMGQKEREDDCTPKHLRDVRNSQLRNDAFKRKRRTAHLLTWEMRESSRIDASKRERMTAHLLEKCEKLSTKN